MINDAKNKYVIFSSWGEKDKGKSMWVANSASEAGEKHRKAFPHEQILLIEKCDKDHSGSDFDLLRSFA